MVSRADAPNDQTEPVKPGAHRLNNIPRRRLRSKRFFPAGIVPQKESVPPPTGRIGFQPLRWRSEICGLNVRQLASTQARGSPMTLQIGVTAPDFEAETTAGRIRFHDWLGDSWGVLFSHPKDFTPICTTELGYMARIKPEFDKRGVKIIGLSVDAVDNHSKWAEDIKETQGFAPNYPMIGDTDLSISKAWGMLPASVSGDASKRTAADNQTVRNVFVIGPDKKIKLVLVYPMTTGRNFDEVLRVIDSLQLTAKHKVATPVNWKPGEDVVIAGSVSDEDAKKQYPQGWKAPKPYIRIVPQPGT
jgi:alkyl hydroperoxide reductase subunit AhpC